MIHEACVAAQFLLARFWKTIRHDSFCFNLSTIQSEELSEHAAYLIFRDAK